MISPLIWNDMIILNLGGETSAAKAFQRKLEREIWASQLSGRGVYLSPEIIKLLNEEHLIIAVEGKIAGLNPRMAKPYGKRLGKFF